VVRFFVLWRTSRFASKRTIKRGCKTPCGNSGGRRRHHHDWELARTLKIGDQATGTSVLSDLYAKWKDNPVQIDLASMWKELGM